MKRHALIVSIKPEYTNLKIARFLKVARSFVCKVRKELKAFALMALRQTYDLLAYQTLILWIITCGALLKGRLISIPITPNPL